MNTQTFSPEITTACVFPQKQPNLRILQPEVTYTGARIKPLQRGLPKTTESLCPECTQVIAARIFEENGKVVMQKFWGEHGSFRDIVFSDAIST